MQSPLFGIGQGSGAGPAAWHAHLLTMIETMSSTHQGYTITDPTSDTSYRQLIVTFVDDTSFLINEVTNKVDTLVTKAEKLINTWLTILRITGGDLSIPKTTWSLLQFDPESPQSKILYTPPTQNIHIHNNGPSDTPTPIPLRNIPPHQGERYLGIRLALDGNMTQEYTFRQAQAQQYKQEVFKSSFNKKEAWLSYHAVWIPRMRYCLPLTTFTQQQCRRVQRSSFEAALPKMGLNRNFPRVVLHGPLKFGGLAIPNMYNDQCILHIRWIIKMLRCKTTLTNLFTIHCRYTQLEAGLGTSIFETKSNLLYLTPSWLSHTLITMQENSLQLFIPYQWIPPLQRQQDQYIMDIAHRFTQNTTILRHLNHCRLYLQAYTISDISTFNGKQIEHWICSPSSSRRTSKWRWPQINTPLLDHGHSGNDLLILP